MKKLFILISAVLCINLFTSCSDSKSDTDYLFYITEQKTKGDFDSEIEEQHYSALKNELSNLNLTRTIDYEENEIESAEDCNIYEDFEDCFNALKSNRKIKASIMPYIEKIGNYATSSNTDYSSIKNYITKVENEAFGIISKEDFDELLQYGESFKAALKISEEYESDLDYNTRGLFKSIWHGINFAISVSVGALLGFGLGYLFTGSLIGAIPTAICFAVGSGIVSYKTGGIAIGYSKRS